MHMLYNNMNSKIKDYKYFLSTTTYPKHKDYI